MTIFNPSRFFRYIAFDVSQNKYFYIKSLLICLGIYCLLLGFFAYLSHRNSGYLIGTKVQLRAFVFGLIPAGTWFMAKHTSVFLAAKKHLPKVSAFEVWLWTIVVATTIFPILYNIICVAFTAPLVLWDGEAIFIPFTASQPKNIPVSYLIVFYFIYLSCCGYTMAFRFLDTQSSCSQTVAKTGVFFSALVFLLTIVRPNEDTYLYFVENVSYQYADNLFVKLFALTFWVILPLMAWFAGLFSLPNGQKQKDSPLAKILLILSLVGLLTSVFLADALGKQLEKTAHHFSALSWSPDVEPNKTYYY